MSGAFPLRYVLPVLTGIVLLAVYPVAKHIGAEEKRRYYTLQCITLLGALAGAKLVVLMGDRFWPVVAIHSLGEVLAAGRSIVGGLLFGFLTAEAVKPLMGYALPPNDRFAAVLPFSLAIGRIGCFLQGCCRGIEHHGWLSVTYSDGIPRYPVQLFEAAFDVAAGVAFVLLVRRGVLRGRLFALFLVAYGVYRFLSEFVRVTPRFLGGYSVYQAFCIVMIAAGLVALFLRRGGFDGSADAAARA
jgi:phosphatidylglycerol:prolipoprotein diacylglycerol transferase